MIQYKNLPIDLHNIAGLNHQIHTYSLKNNLVGKSYTTLELGSEPDTELDPWHYKINEHGYRGSNWQVTRLAIPFFGCSITFGIGVDIDISSAVTTNTGKLCYNIGQPGASSITILKTFVNFNKFFPTDTVFITLPALDRIYYPTYYDNSWVYRSILADRKDDNNREIHDIAFKFFSTDTNTAYIYDYVKMAELSAKINNTTIIWGSWCQHTVSFLKDVIEGQIVPIGDMRGSVARDRAHPGPTFVTDWAKNICSFLNNKN